MRCNKAGFLEKSLMPFFLLPTVTAMNLSNVV